MNPKGFIESRGGGDIIKSTLHGQSLMMPSGAKNQT